MIHVDPVETDGEIREVDVFSGGDGTRTLRIGVYKSVGPTLEFRLLRSFDALNVPVGLSTVRFIRYNTVFSHVKSSMSV